MTSDSIDRHVASRILFTTYNNRKSINGQKMFNFFSYFIFYILYLNLALL